MLAHPSAATAIWQLLAEGLTLRVTDGWGRFVRMTQLKVRVTLLRAVFAGSWLAAGSGGTGFGDDVTATAFVFEAAAAGAGCVANGLFHFPNRFRNDFDGGRLRQIAGGDVSKVEVVEVPVEVLVDFELRCVRGLLTLDEFDDFDGGFQARRRGRLWIT